MCGIVGIHGPEAARVAAMNEAQRHRGPDGAGAFAAPAQGLTLAMRRLAILDVAGGTQPMYAADGRFALVYNGEIMNAPELRQALEAAGEVFTTDHSDTEVLLRLLVREGIDALPKLNGMFAFALYDSAANELLLARDRMGIKPLHWFDDGRHFAFASEIKSLLELPFVGRAIDKDAIYHYMSLLYVPGPSTAFVGVHRLEPGRFLRYRLADRHVEIRRWWSPVFAPDTTMPDAAWPERVRATLAEASRRWTLSDAPVACSLSGGLDSSAIVGLLARDGQRLGTFTLGFDGAEGAALDERDLARAVALRWGTEHTEIALAPEALLDDLPAMAWAMDEPYAGGLPSWAVFRAMARSVKVGLTGTGGDELFGNYGKWRWLHDSWGLKLGGKVTRARFARDFFGRVYYFADADKRAVLGDFARDIPDTSDLLFGHFARAEGATLRDKLAAVDLETQLPDEFLAMTDRFSMAHSLEARPPFLDNAMVDLALRIPANLRAPRAGDAFKALLKCAVAPVLPDALLAAPKRGFVVPMAAWLRGRLRAPLERLMAPERLAEQGIFGPQFRERYMLPHFEGRADHRHKLWAALMFQIWHRLFVEGVSIEALRAELRA
jgi:asparagine synthase (glutamine-hydrolysing)